MKVRWRRACAYAAGVGGAFVFIFVQPGPAATDAVAQLLQELLFDPDTANYSLVKSHADGRHVTTYSDMPWEPKEALKAVADYYATHKDV